MFPLVSEAIYVLIIRFAVAGNALLAKVVANLDTLQLDVAPLCSAEIKCLLLLLFSRQLNILLLYSNFNQGCHG